MPVSGSSPSPAPEHPVALAGIVFDAEVVAHRDQLGIALPPFAEHALGSVGALHAPAHAAPSEGYGRMIRKKRDRLDRLGAGEQPRGPRPMARPLRAGVRRERWDMANRALGNVAGDGRGTIQIPFADPIGERDR